MNNPATVEARAGKTKAKGYKLKSMRLLRFFAANAVV